MLSFTMTSRATSAHHRSCLRPAVCLSAPAFQLAPMVDVVFVIMLFFLVAAATRQSEQTLSMELPGTVRSMPDIPLDLDVQIESDGAVLVNGEVFDTSPTGSLRLTQQVLQRIAAEARQSATKILATLEVAPDVPYQRIMETLDALALASVTNVSFATASE